MLFHRVINSNRHLPSYCTAQSDQCSGADAGVLERGFICILEGVEVRFADFITFLLNIS